MKNFSILILSTFLMFSCKNEKTINTPNGEVNYQFISCRDYTKEFKDAFINVVKNQNDNFFKQSPGMTLSLAYNEKDCYKVSRRISTVKANEKEDWALYSEEITNELIGNCENNKPYHVVEAEFSAYNTKNQLIDSIKNSDYKLSIDTDKNCRISIRSNKDELTMRLFIDNQVVKDFNFDFRNMIHPVEISLRVNGIQYNRSFNPLRLTESELQANVKNCSNKYENNERVCTSTNRTLRDYLSI